MHVCACARVGQRESLCLCICVCGCVHVCVCVCKSVYVSVGVVKTVNVIMVSGWRRAFALSYSRYVFKYWRYFTSAVLKTTNIGVIFDAKNTD